MFLSMAGDVMVSSTSCPRWFFQRKASMACHPVLLSVMTAAVMGPLTPLHEVTPPDHVSQAALNVLMGVVYVCRLVPASRESHTSQAQVYAGAKESLAMGSLCSMQTVSKDLPLATGVKVMASALLLRRSWALLRP